MAFLDLPRPHAFAHRGGAREGLENAASQFAEVRAMGYRYVETDVRTTADGVAVVFHDEDAERVTGEPGRIADLPYERVRRLAQRGGEPVPRLDEVLAAFPDLRFNLDLKDEGGVAAVPEVLRRTGAADRVCLTSFSHRRVERVRAALPPGTCTGLGTGGVLRLLATGRAGGASVAQLPWVLPGGRTLPAAVVRRAQRAGLAVHVWTVDERAQVEAALDRGVDGVMTDAPDVLKQVLVERGLWA